MRRESGKKLFSIVADDLFYNKVHGERYGIFHTNSNVHGERYGIFHTNRLFACAKRQGLALGNNTNSGKEIIPAPGIPCEKLSVMTFTRGKALRSTFTRGKPVGDVFHHAEATRRCRRRVFHHAEVVRNVARNAVSKTGMCMGEVMGKAMRMSVGEAGFALANSFSPCESHGGSHDVGRVRMRIAWQTPRGKLSESFIRTS